jgi:hypothetical protein
MEATTLGFDRYIDELADDFVLLRHPSGTAVTRTTPVTARGRLRGLRYAMVAVGLKSVHRFVFRNWQVAPQHLPVPD